MAKGLYSDLNDFIEGGGREEQLPDKNVENEGNISQGNPDTSSPRQEGNISQEDPQPKEPNTKGNIDPQDPQTESPQTQGNIRQSESEEEAPQRRGNIGSGESAPESPNVEGNIDPRENRPEDPNRQPIDTEENQEQEPERNSIPISDNAPDPPQRRGNIVPRGIQDEPDRKGIQPDEQNRPSAPRKRGNIVPGEDNEPENPNRVEIEPDENARPSDAQKGSRSPKENAAPKEPDRSGRGAEENAAPKSPNRRVINLREEAAPKGPNRTGNIASQSRQPPEPQRRDNIQPDEEPPTTEPAEDTNITARIENRPPEDDRTGNIEVNDTPPGPPQRDGNINLREEAAPQEPNVEGNIETEDNPPEEPQREDNINESDRRPPEPNRNENIETEDNPPQNANREGNIEAEESRPDDPERSGNIVPPDEPSPDEPGREGNISPTEESEPPEPNLDENITPTEESEPPEPQLEDNINEEDRRPQGPQLEDNINEADRRPPEPQQEGNIDPTNKETTDGIGGEEIEREQPLKFQSERFADQIDPENVEFVDQVPGDEDGAGEWEVPLRHQPQNYVGQIDQTSEQFRDGIGETFTGEGDGAGEWEVPLRHQPENYADQINPQSAQFRDGIGEAFDGENDGDEWQAPLKHISKAFEEQIDPQSQEYRDGLGESFPGEDDGVGEWEVPLRHQPSTYAGQIDPESAEFRDGIGAEFVGENDGAGEWEVPLRYQPENYADQIDPASAEFRDGIGEEFVGENDGDEWQSPLKHISNQFAGQIDQTSEQFRDGIGDTFPGESDGAGEWEVPLRHHPENYAGQIDPESAEFRDGIGEEFVGENDGDEWQAPLKHISTRFADQINPNDPATTDGVGGDEPGGELQNDPWRQTDVDRDSESPKRNRYQPVGLEASPFLDQEFTDTDTDGIYPFGEADSADEWQVPLRHQPKSYANQIDQTSEEFRDGIGELFVGEGDGIDEWEASPLRHQPENYPDEINPQSVEFRDGLGETFPGEDDSSDEWEVPLRHHPKGPNFDGQIQPEQLDTTEQVEGANQSIRRVEVPNRFQRSPLPDRIEAVDNPPQNFQTGSFGRQEIGRGQGQEKEETFQERNRVIRLRQFESFGDVNRSLSVGGILIGNQNPGFSREPFVLRRPEAGGGSLANIKQADSRTAPIGSAPEDVTRLSQFFATGKGLVYNVRQQFLQKQNPRSRTKLYDPTSPIQTAAEGVASRPGQEITRHVSPESGPQGIVGDAAQVVGDTVGEFDVPQSARYEDELEETATPTDWGEMRGSLFWLSPAARNPLPEVTGNEAMARFRRLQSENVSNVEELYSSSEKEGLSRFGRQQLTAQGVVGSGYLFTQTYDPQGGPNSDGREKMDNYHPSAPYVTNVDSMNQRENPSAASFNPADLRKVPDSSVFNSFLFRENQRERASGESTFPYVNPTRTPDRTDVVDGDGNVQFPIQNETTDNAYYENRTFTQDRIPLHRGVPERDQSYGMPNYSAQDDDGNKQKRIDLINRLEPIIGESAESVGETYGDGSYKDIIPFKFFDIENQGTIIFRAFLEGISDNLSPQWSQQDYAGRPEQAHLYGGYTNSISFSFQAAPFTEEEFQAIWKKVNYLKGLTTPASYSSAAGGGSYMTPPFMRLTIGDLFNDVYGYMNSLSISFNDDADWEIDEDAGRLPKIIEVDVDWQVIENRAPVALQKYYDAPFIEAIENPVRESPESRSEILPQSADPALEAPDVDQGRAIEKANGETLPEADPEDTPELPTDQIGL